jgi:orotidine-5'-phosphate decarboxylase
MPDRPSPRDFLAVALDVPRLDAAEDLVRRLAGVPGWLKVGAELFTAVGPAALASAASVARVFLDAKLHDIPNTVAGAVASATRHGVGMITLHAAGGLAMLRAAREAAEETAQAAGVARPLLVGVTVLTSLSPADLKDLGIQANSVDEQVARMLDLALAAGLDGVVASPREAAAIRQRAGPGLRIVTPGVRPAGHQGDDQQRTATAGDAIQAGADLLVVGRTVVRAPDPAAAARALVREIELALGSRRA